MQTFSRPHNDVFLPVSPEEDDRMSKDGEDWRRRIDDAFLVMVIGPRTFRKLVLFGGVSLLMSLILFAIKWFHGESAPGDVP